MSKSVEKTPRPVVASSSERPSSRVRVARSRAASNHRDSAFHDAYEVSGDGVARANLAKLSMRQSFRDSVRSALQRNGVIDAEAGKRETLPD